MLYRATIERIINEELRAMGLEDSVHISAIAEDPNAVEDYTIHLAHKDPFRMFSIRVTIDSPEAEGDDAIRSKVQSELRNHLPSVG